MLILAYDTLYRNTTFFTNYHTKKEDPNGSPWYYAQPLWKICASSASAPTFFPGFELSFEETLYTNYKENKKIESEKGEPILARWSYPHVDGGVTANNPSLCAIARALELGYKLENISLLSIGSGKDTEPYEFKQIEGWGLIKWARRITNVLMAGQGEVQDRICCSLMGGRESKQYLRLQFDLNQTMYAKEDIDKDDKLYNQVHKEVLKDQKIALSDQEVRTALKEFAQMPVIRNKNLRKNQLIGERIDNDMSNASQDNIKRLKSAAEKYINDEKSYTFENSHKRGLQVLEAIKKFILSEPQKTFDK